MKYNTILPKIMKDSDWLPSLKLPRMRGDTYRQLVGVVLVLFIVLFSILKQVLIVCLFGGIFLLWILFQILVPQRSYVAYKKKWTLARKRVIHVLNDFDSRLTGWMPETPVVIICSEKDFQEGSNAVIILLERYARIHSIAWKKLSTRPIDDSGGAVHLFLCGENELIGDNLQMNDTDKNSILILSGERILFADHEDSTPAKQFHDYLSKSLSAEILPDDYNLLRYLSKFDNPDETFLFSENYFIKKLKTAIPK